MTMWAVVWSKLQAVGNWCKTHWKWLLPPIALLVWYFTRSKTVTVASGAVVEHDAVVHEADKKAAEETAEVNKAATKALNDIGEEHGKDVAKLEADAKEEADKALASPEATNEFLKDVSTGMRK